MSSQFAGFERELSASQLDCVSGGGGNIDAIGGLSRLISSAFQSLQQSRHPEAGTSSPTGTTSGSGGGLKSASFDPVTVTFGK